MIRPLFMDMTEEKNEQLLEAVNCFAIENLWIAEYVCPGRNDEKWLNLILRKKE